MKLDPLKAEVSSIAERFTEHDGIQFKTMSKPTENVSMVMEAVAILFQ